MKHTLIALWLVALAGTPAAAQTTALEVQESAGASSESIAGAGTQVRFFGELTPALKYRIETAWGTRSHRPIAGQYGSDLLGTAYPYGNRLEIIEGYAEYFFPDRSIVQSVK